MHRYIENYELTQLMVESNWTSDSFVAESMSYHAFDVPVYLLPASATAVPVKRIQPKRRRQRGASPTRSQYHSIADSAEEAMEIRVRLSEVKVTPETISKTTPAPPSPLGRNDAIEAPPTPLTRRVRLTSWGVGLLFFIYITMLLFVTFGAYLDTFSYVYTGVIEPLLGSDSVVNYSVISFGATINQSAGDNSSSSNVMGSEYYFFFFSFVAAALSMVISSYVWFVPLTFDAQRKAITIMECFNAYNCFDVFVFCLLGSYAQLSMVRAI